MISANDNVEAKNPPACDGRRVSWMGLVAVPADREGLEDGAALVLSEGEAGANPEEAPALNIGGVQAPADVDGAEVTG